MKKRLRKKRRFGEFREFGFTLDFKMQESLEENERFAMFDRFIDFVEANNLQYGGGGGPVSWSGVVALWDRGSATEEHQGMLLEWLNAQPEVKEASVGPLFDVWHGEPSES